MTVALRTYHGESGEPIDVWEDVDACEIVFEEYGPKSAKTGLVRGVPALHHSRLMPGGLGAFLEIDARGLGVPDVWLGRIDVPQIGPGAIVPIGATGPESWLASVGVAPSAESAEPAAWTVRRSIQEARRPTWCRFDAGSAYLGVRTTAVASAQSLWAQIEAYRADRDELPLFIADAGRVRFTVRWAHPLAGSEVQGDVRLVDGENCTLTSSAVGAGMTRDELVAVARSWGAGSGLQAALVRAPRGAAIGRRGALAAVLQSAQLTGLLAGDVASGLPEIGERDALELALETRLRRLMVPPVLGQIADVDPALWPYCRPGNVLSATLHDPYGLFNRALVRITSATFRPTPPLACSLSVELWDAEA